MTKGFVYILSNEAMPGLVKIGLTRRSSLARSNELFQTGVPTAFRLEFEIKTFDCNALERAVHESLAHCRVSANREFFRISLADAIEALSDCDRSIRSEFLAEYFPGCAIVEEPFLVDPSEIMLLAERAAAHPYDVANAFPYLEPDDISAALARWRGVLSERRSKRALVSRSAARVQ